MNILCCLILAVAVLGLLALVPDAIVRTQDLYAHFYNNTGD